MKQKQFLSDLKEQWKRLWSERFEDRVKAEGVARDDYSMLFVERGVVISATRDFKTPSFREILEMHQRRDKSMVVEPHPSVGGWGKFVRTVIAAQRKSRRGDDARLCVEVDKKTQQSKKGRRGWLHV